MPTAEEDRERERASEEEARSQLESMFGGGMTGRVMDKVGARRDARAEDRQRTLEPWEDILADAPTADQLSPEYSLLGESEAAGAEADPRMVDAQLRALGQMEEWGRGEMTSADLARRDLSRRALAQDERSQREGVMRGMAERGMSGGGLEAMGMLGAQQGMADRLSAQDAALQVAVQDRALRAMESAGAMASRGREQSFGEQYQRGSAVDRFNMYNTDTTNRQADRRAQAEQQAWENRGAGQEAYDNAYSRYEERQHRRNESGSDGATTGDVFGAIGGGIGMAAGGPAGGRAGQSIGGFLGREAGGDPRDEDER